MRGAAGDKVPALPPLRRVACCCPRRTRHGAGDRALGEYLSSECVTCHQITGRYEGIPPIVGWPEATFIEIMDEYRDKRRSNPVMQTIAGKVFQG